MVLGSLVPGSSHNDPNNPAHNHDYKIAPMGNLIWPVQTPDPQHISSLSFFNPSWDGDTTHTYVPHTGIDIGYGSMSETEFYDKKSQGYFANVIAAADGEILALISDQGDFCTKEVSHDPNHDLNINIPGVQDYDGSPRSVLQLGPNCTGG